MSESTSKSENDPTSLSPQTVGENATAIEAISERLTEVTQLAEELDQTLTSAQQDCSVGSPAALSAPIPILKRGDGGSFDEVGLTVEINFLKIIKYVENETLCKQI